MERDPNPFRVVITSGGLVNATTVHASLESAVRGGLEAETWLLNNDAGVFWVTVEYRGTPVWMSINSAKEHDAPACARRS